MSQVTSTLSFKELHDDLLFVPLGGAGEIGMNLNLYQYKGKWLIADFGAGFAEDYLPGVDMIVPDITFIRERKKDIVGMILTHAHEDHLGGVQYLWDELECSIYTTTFTANFLRAKLAEYSFKQRIPIHEVTVGKTLKLDPFSIDFTPLTHSTPEMQALLITTDKGTVFHTGDWKLDPNPLIGEAVSETTMRAFGDDGILAVIGDSTNIFKEHHSGSEGDLRESLTKLVAECPKLAVVTTFASNVARLETIIRAGEEAGRRVVLAGKSLYRVLNAARESGYLKDIPPLVELEDAKRFPKEKLLIICTGCQGEPLAAATKMANGSHPHLKIDKGDTIIFSSKIIPGNDKRIFRLFNQFIRLGVEVMTEKDHFVHVSGHPSREELREMYGWLKPHIVIPVHGELMHMHEHIHLVDSLGIPHSVQVENGSVVVLERENPRVIGHVQSGYLAIDGRTLIPVNSPVMQMRRRMMREGIVFVTLLVSGRGQLLQAPIIRAPGCLDMEEDKELFLAMEEAIFDAFETLGNHTKRKMNLEETIQNQVRSAIRRIIRHDVGKNPPIELHVEMMS